LESWYFLLMILGLDSLIKIMGFQCELSSGQWSPIGVWLGCLTV
jgi:hypothetical protein